MRRLQRHLSPALREEYELVEPGGAAGGGGADGDSDADGDGEGEGEGGGVELLGGGGGEEDSFEALCSDAMSLLCALASLRGEAELLLLCGAARLLSANLGRSHQAVLLLLCGELAPLLPRFSGADAASLDADGAADVVTSPTSSPRSSLPRPFRDSYETRLVLRQVLLADCLVAVLPSAAAASTAPVADEFNSTVSSHESRNQAASIAPVAELSRHVAAALGRLGQRASSSRPLLAAAVSLLRLVGALCSWLASLLEAPSSAAARPHHQVARRGAGRRLFPRRRAGRPQTAPPQSGSSPTASPPCCSSRRLCSPPPPPRPSPLGRSARCSSKCLGSV